MSLKTAIIHSLLRRLGNNPSHKPAEQPTPPCPVAPVVSASENDNIVRVAVLPDPNAAIDATLAHLYPAPDEDGDGFTCIAHLDAIDKSLEAIVRKVLAAGSAIDLVRPDYEVDGAYQVHRDFYKLLARLRSSHVPHQLTLPAVLTNSLKTTPTETLDPTETDITKALSDLASGISEFVILARKDTFADYIQTAGGSPPFRVECRIWLNDWFAQHFHITDPKNQGDFADINEVGTIMLHWLRTGRLPSHVAIKNITNEIS